MFPAVGRHKIIPSAWGDNTFVKAIVGNKLTDDYHDEKIMLVLNCQNDSNSMDVNFCTLNKSSQRLVVDTKSFPP